MGLHNTAENDIKKDDFIEDADQFPPPSVTRTTKTHRVVSFNLFSLSPIP